MNSKQPRPLALVTGASSGIGRAFAVKLAQEGHDLLLVARRPAELAALAAELKSHGAAADCLTLDLTDPGAVEAIATALGERDLALLVNNAGFGLFGLFADSDGARELAMIDLNVRVPTQLSKRLLPNLSRARGGIINVASTAAFQPGPWMAVYYATKAYVLSFSEAIAEELGPRGVRVMALCPGPIRSGFQDTATMQRSGLLRMPLPSAQWAVDSAWRAWRRGSRVHIPGSLNKAMAFSVRLTPRRWMTALVRMISAPV
ncbi:MAG: SDR family oxidoreductase [Rhodanobacteraceae bacterium]|nr:SDR family oxidoreductase [Rhodanobacteraceae bacterium]